MPATLINVPPRARRGEVIDIKALVAHPMESGYRRTQTGVVIPRNILRRFVCTYAGEEIFRAEIHPGIAANPFFAFSTVAAASGRIEFTWTGDEGFTLTARADIEVV